MNDPINIIPANYPYSWSDVTPQTSWVEGMIPVGGSVLLFGPAGVGKTTFVCNLMNAVAAGDEFMGRQTTPTDAMLLSLDTPKATMMRRWLNNKPKFSPAFRFAPYSPFNCLDPLFTKSQLYTQVQAAIRPHTEIRVINKGKKNESEEEIQHPRIQLVVVDSLRDVFDGEMIHDDNPKNVYGIFQKWFDGATVIFLHHTRKEQRVQGKIVEGNIDDEATGSKYWINKAQVALYLKKSNEKILSLQMGKSQCYEGWDQPVRMEIDGALVHHWDKTRAGQQSATFAAAQAHLQAADPNWAVYGETDRDEAIKQHLNVSIRTVRNMKAAFRKTIP